MKIGEKIKELRIEHGFSQAMLAKQIGASQKAVDYWERGVNEPKASYVIALVRFSAYRSTNFSMRCTNIYAVALCVLFLVGVKRAFFMLFY